MTNEFDIGKKGLDENVEKSKVRIEGGWEDPALFTLMATYLQAKMLGRR